MNLDPIDQAGETVIDAGDARTAARRYGADGTPIVMVDAVETAVEIAAGHGLGFVTVH